jgi:hypothetical protein
MREDVEGSYTTYGLILHRHKAGVPLEAIKYK